jgi:hypothetical protein
MKPMALLSLKVLPWSVAGRRQGSPCRIGPRSLDVAALDDVDLVAEFLLPHSELVARRRRAAMVPGLPTTMSGSCRFNAVMDESRPFLVHAVIELAEPILTGESAPIGARTPKHELASCWVAWHREGVTMGELANRLDDTLHITAGNREGLAVMPLLNEVSRWLTEVDEQCGAGVLRSCAGVRR